MNNVKQLHLHDFHVKHSAKFTNFAGWEMPVSYGSSVSEHMRVRNKLGLFDVSHMGEIIIKGPEALEFLNYVLTNDLNKISDRNLGVVSNDDAAPFPGFAIGHITFLKPDLIV